MPDPALKQRERARLSYEINLHESGFVPLVSFDAPAKRLHRALPRCRLRQIVPDRQPHGLIVWSHPGPSGLDPRALGPLAVVRVADGAGADPLDEPMTLAQAVRWLLVGDVERWLTRPRHRALLEDCVEQERTCLKHPVDEALLQDVADALGDPTFAQCHVRSSSACPWSEARTVPDDVVRLARAALDATRRLGEWYVAGARGREAWELTVNGVPPAELGRWHAAGFSTAEAALWSRRGGVRKAVQARDEQVSPYQPLVLPPPATAPPGQRGLHWYAQFGLARHGRSAEILLCGYCGAKDVQDPCRTCRAERRVAPVNAEWASYTQLLRVHPAFGDAHVGDAVPCGASNCQSPLGSSAVDEGARQ